MTLFEKRGPAEVSVSRYARMLIQDLLAALEERGLPLAVKIGEDEWLLKDDPADCGRQVEDKIKELLTLIKGSRNLGSHHNIQKAKRYIEENYDMEDLSLQESCSLPVHCPDKERIPIGSVYFSFEVK